MKSQNKSYILTFNDIKSLDLIERSKNVINNDYD